VVGLCLYRCRLQETASSNQTAVLQLQGHVDQHQQLQQQQQENMVALRAQVRQSDMSCAANVTACAELRAGLQQLQQRLDQCCKDVARHADQMVELSEQQQVCLPWCCQLGY
jgi:predicted P-loop ATPase/GTPase